MHISGVHCKMCHSQAAFSSKNTPIRPMHACTFCQMSSRYAGDCKRRILAAAQLRRISTCRSCIHTSSYPLQRTAHCQNVATCERTHSCLICALMSFLSDAERNCVELTKILLPIFSIRFRLPFIGIMPTSANAVLPIFVSYTPLCSVLLVKTRKPS